MIASNFKAQINVIIQKARAEGKTWKQIHKDFHSRTNPITECNVDICKKAVKSNKVDA